MDAPCGSTLSHMANPCQGGRREAERELLSFLILSLASRGICAKTFSCSAVGRCMLRCTARCRSWCALIRTSLPITSMAPPSPPSCLSSTSSASSTRSSLKHACSSLSSEARETRAPVARAAASCSAARGRKGPPARERARTAGLRSCKSSVCARSRTSSTRAMLPSAAKPASRGESICCVGGSGLACTASSPTSGFPAVVHAAARLLASLLSLFSHPLGGSDLQHASTSAPPRVAPARSATAQSASAALPRRYVGCCPRLCCSPPLLPSPSEAGPAAPARSTPSPARSCRQCASPPPAAPAAALPAAPPSAAAEACKASAPAQRCM
mmetsp:Transcript_5623/g.16828  ORF Transcript_5623/g.16828 Transcript_5623/m.16828 type:complete len:327 (+) Transcript_5623:257-1237(+)